MTNKKYYEVCVLNGNWEELHKELCKETECEFIPNRIVECYDEVNHSKNRARYLLADEEAETLRNHPEVKYVDLDLTFYPELEPKNILFGEFTKREYTNPVGWPRIHRNPSATVNLTNLDSEIKRTSWGLKRIEEISNNFFNNSSSTDHSTSPIYTKFTGDGTIISVSQEDNDIAQVTLGEEQESPTRLQRKKYTQFLRDNSEKPEVAANITPEIRKYYGEELKSVNYLKSGQNVDIVVIDNGVLQYHPEFTDRFSKKSGATGEKLFQGRSRVRDLILDGPYYLDPEYFDTNTTDEYKIKTVKKDGRPTCTRQGAFDWWTSINKRSSKFKNVATISYSSISALIENTNKAFNYFEENVIGGPPAPGHETFGDAKKADPFNMDPNNGPINFEHGTPCAGVCAGKDYGSAVDARIWNLSLKFTNIGFVSSKDAYTFVKIFHAAKKTCFETDVRYSGGSFTNKIKDSPTILNQSFGTKTNIERYYFVPIAYSLSDAWTSGSTGPFNGNQYTFNQFFNGVRTTYTMTVSQTTVSEFNNLTGERELIKKTKLTLNNIKDAFLFSKRMLVVEDREGTVVAGTSLPQQKQSIEEALAEGVIAVTSGGNSAQYYSANDPPNSIELPTILDGSTIETETVKPHEKGYPADGGGFLVGAADSTITLDTSEIPRETITPWTSRGPSIDLFAPGETVLSSSNKNDHFRYDARNNGKIALFDEDEANKYGRFYDRRFGGTSCACPLTVGVLALRLEEKSNSTEAELRTWLNTQGSIEGAFYDPIPRESNARYFRSRFNLLGSPNRMLHNPYVEKVYSFELTNPKLLDTAERSTDKFYSELVGLSRDESIELLEDPPDTNDSNYEIFKKLVKLLDAQNPADLSKYRPVRVSFGGRNNGGNAKDVRQVVGITTFYAMGGGGGGGFYGGGGGNKGGAGGGGSGLARDDASVANNKTGLGGNSSEGFARIWLNEKSDRSRDDYDKGITTR